MEENKKKIKNKNFIDSCRHAIDGLIYAITTQSNIQKQLIIAIGVIILSLFYPLKTTEFLCLIFAVVFVIFSEMINTAIETVVDLYIDVYHPKAKIAKDVGAGAVLLMSINSIIVAYFLFLKETDLTNFGKSVFNNMVSSPIHLAFAGIMITLIIVILVKSLFRIKQNKNIKEKNIIEKENVPKSKFEPSGQSAIAGAIITAVGFNTNNILIFILSVILGLLVLENRIEDRKKSIAGVIFGTFMGILIVLLIYGLNIFRM